jgi:hypothetical protein
MLLNNDIQCFFGQMILHFQNEINLIIYIIEFVLKIKYNHFIWIECQKNVNFQSLCFCNVKIKIFDK